jgi:two-component system phosphate regulon response regulator PhoB
MPVATVQPQRAHGIEFDPEQATLRLWRGDRWHVLDLSANECRLLSCLLNDLDRVHSREAIREAVWPGAAVDLRTVDQAVRRLRRALSRVDAQNLIKTVNGAGYRLVPDVL